MSKREHGTSKKVTMPLEAAVILTYRCPMKCTMCGIHDHPSKPELEIKPDICEKLPDLKFVNITGGEPFVREDLGEFVARLSRKADRIVISTSGWFVERTIALAEKYPKVGFRISLEGLPEVNDRLRGRKGGFDRGLRVLLELRKMGIKDIGFGITISDANAEEMLLLYELSRAMKMEFATAVVHNSFYFHTSSNRFREPEKVCGCIGELVGRLLRENNVKSWFRAYFNCGLIRCVQGKSRLLPCEAGTVNFFLDPDGEIYPCNGCDPQYWFESMGNIKQNVTFGDVWGSEQAEKVRALVRTCRRGCWMIGTASPVMKKYFRYPLLWVIRNKLRSMAGKSICIDEPVPHREKNGKDYPEEPVQEKPL